MVKPKLLYVFDPLCGWCYGFGPVIRELEDKYQSDIDFETLVGGMVLGDRVGPIGAMKDYLKRAIPNLEDVTGVKMGSAYMEIIEEGSRTLNSELPCKAMTVFKSMSSDSSVKFAAALQDKLYQDGRDLGEEQVYEELCTAFGLPWEAFAEKLKSQQYKEKTYGEFEYVKKLGVNGFPTVLMFIGEKGYLLARGYRPLDDMCQVIEQVMTEKNDLTR